MSREMRNPRVLLALILFAGLIPRVAGLGVSPPALNSDELLKAFDGASVYLTGRDHHGAAWPMFFEQSGEWSPPLYIYFTGLFSAPFGVNPYTNRLPSAILGTLSIGLTFLLMRRALDERAGLIAALLVAISPWNLFYSRIGWEAISLIPLQLAGLWLFMRWAQEGRFRDVMLSAAAFALTTYAYPTARLSTPLMGVGLLICFWEVLGKKARQAALGAVFYLLIQAPFVYTLLEHREAMQARWAFLSVFQSPEWPTLIVTHYLQHLSPMFLFVTGDANPAHGLAGGVALMALAPLFALGVFSILRYRTAFGWLLLYWLLTFAIPSSLTFDRFDPRSMPNALRSVGGMPVIELISTLGIVWLWNRLGDTTVRKGVFACIAVAVIVNTGWIAYDAAVRFPVYAAPAFQYGLRDVVEYAEAHKGEYDRIVISDKVRLHPVALAIFSGRDPGPFSGKDFPKYIIPFYHYVPVYGDFRTNVYQRFAGLELNQIARWYNLAPGKNLLIALPNEIDGASPVLRVAYPDGSTAYEVFESKNG